MDISTGEINFLTEDRTFQGINAINEIETEFDLILLWWSMMAPFGIDARKILDRFMALSLRKLLCDKNSLLRKVCPTFKMPPLNGKVFKCPGDNNEMALTEIHPSMKIAPKDK